MNVNVGLRILFLASMYQIRDKLSLFKKYKTVHIEYLK